MTKKTISEKEQNLLDVIAKAKKDLIKLKVKQKNEIGMLANKYNLGAIESSILERAFKEIADRYSAA